MYLRLQDFKIVSEYNFALFKISSQLKLCGEKITKEEKTLLYFMPWMWSYNSNTKSVDLKNTLNKYHVTLLLNKIMSFWWEITSLIQLDLNHSLKWMQYHPKLVDMDEDKEMVVVVEGIPNIMVIMVIIPQILIKGKLHCTSRSEIILRQNKKMGNVCKINL